MKAMKVLRIVYDIIGIVALIYCLFVILPKVVWGDDFRHWGAINDYLRCDDNDNCSWGHVLEYTPMLNVTLNDGDVLTCVVDLNGIVAALWCMKKVDDPAAITIPLDRDRIRIYDIKRKKFTQ